jgi:hypothetical protein
MARVMERSWPTQKVQAGFIAGALTTIIIWIVQAKGVAVPGDVAAAITTILSALLAYFVPPADRDVSVPVPRERHAPV